MDLLSTLAWTPCGPAVASITLPPLDFLWQCPTFYFDWPDQEIFDIPVTFLTFRFSSGFSELGMLSLCEMPHDQLSPDSLCSFWFCMILRALHQTDKYPNILIFKYTLILGNIQYPVFRGEGPYCFTIGFASILSFWNLYIVYQTRFCGILVFWNLYIGISDPQLQGPTNCLIIYILAVILPIPFQWF